MNTMIQTLLKNVRIVVILVMLVFTWGNRLVSPNVNFEVKPMVVQGAENTCQLRTMENEDGTYTVTLYVKDNLGGFDFGIAFSPKEVAVLEYGFTEGFKNHYSKQKGSVIDYYFEEGKRVSEDARYIVYGGMATDKAAYDGEVCYVKVSLKGEQATLYGTKDSAAYDHAKEIMAGGISCSIVKGVDLAGMETKEEQTDSNQSNQAKEESFSDEQEKEMPSGDGKDGKTVSDNRLVGNREETVATHNGPKEKVSEDVDGKRLQKVDTDDHRVVVPYVVVMILMVMIAARTGKGLFDKK